MPQVVTFFCFFRTASECPCLSFNDSTRVVSPHAPSFSVDATLLSLFVRIVLHPLRQLLVSPIVGKSDRTITEPIGCLQHCRAMTRDKQRFKDSQRNQGPTIKNPLRFPLVLSNCEGIHHALITLGPITRDCSKPPEENMFR